MKKFIVVLLLAFVAISCNVYNQVTLDQETIIYDKSGSEANAIYTIPKGSAVYITGKKTHKKIKFGNYVGWAFNPSYSTSTTSNYRTSTNTESRSSNNKTVQVKGYYRKNGTYVRPHTRSAPRRK